MVSLLLMVAVTFCLCIPAIISIIKAKMPIKPAPSSEEAERALLAKGSHCQRTVEGMRRAWLRLTSVLCGLMERTTHSREVVPFLLYVVVSAALCIIWWNSLCTEAGAAYLYLQRVLGDEGTSIPTIQQMPFTLTGRVVLSFIAFGTLSGLILLESLGVLRLLPFIHKSLTESSGVADHCWQIVGVCGTMSVLCIAGVIGWERMSLIQQEQATSTDLYISTALSVTFTATAIFSFTGVLVIAIATVVVIALVLGWLFIWIPLWFNSHHLRRIQTECLRLGIREEERAHTEDVGPIPREPGSGETNVGNDEGGDDPNSAFAGNASSGASSEESGESRRRQAAEDPLGASD